MKYVSDFASFVFSATPSQLRVHQNISIVVSPCLRLLLSGAPDALTDLIVGMYRLRGL